MRQPRPAPDYARPSTVFRPSTRSAPSVLVRPTRTTVIGGPSREQSVQGRRRSCRVPLLGWLFKATK
jgi:hypothetical protein